MIAFLSCFSEMRETRWKNGDLVVTLAPPRKGFTLAELAVLAMAMGAAIYALIPVALEFFGSDWKVGRPEREAANRERAKEAGVGAR